MIYLDLKMVKWLLMVELRVNINLSLLAASASMVSSTSADWSQELKHALGKIIVSFGLTANIPGCVVITFSQGTVAWGRSRRSRG